MFWTSLVIFCVCLSGTSFEVTCTLSHRTTGPSRLIFPLSFYIFTKAVTDFSIFFGVIEVTQVLLN